MQNEKLYIYFDSNTESEAKTLLENLSEISLSAEFINVDTNEEANENVKGFSDTTNESLPILRIGNEKVRSILTKPTKELLNIIFSNQTDNRIQLPKPIVYGTTFCGDCAQLKFWMDSKSVSYNEILIEDSEELKEQVVKWSGGRRVVPTVHYENIGKFFNPGLSVFQKLHQQQS